MFEAMTNWKISSVGSGIERHRKERKRKEVTNRLAARRFTAAKQVAALTMWHICHLRLGAHKELPATTEHAFSPHILPHRLTCSSHMPFLFEARQNSTGYCCEERNKDKKESLSPPVWTLLWWEWQHAVPGDASALLLSLRWTQQVPAVRWN